MRLLLDTHVYLWWLQDEPRLSAQARSKIIAAMDVYVSAASIWEASIKSALGKLDVNVNELVAQIKGNGFKELPVSAHHAASVVGLPARHKDPFDRLLVTQSVCEQLRFLTHDTKLQAYSDLVELI